MLKIADGEEIEENGSLAIVCDPALLFPTSHGILTVEVGVGVEKEEAEVKQEEEEGAFMASSARAAGTHEGSASPPSQ